MQESNCNPLIMHFDLEYYHVLFVNALKRADELAVAMEARCYRGGEGRTRMNVLKYSRTDYIVMALVTVFFGLVIASRYFLNIWIFN